ncbi:MAG: hypothetical protein ABW352_25175 [Polyangiales bacterium]
MAGLIAVPKLPLPVLSPLPDSPTAEQVRATVDANRGALQRCYDDWLAQHPLRGNSMFVVDVALSISPEGASEQMSLRGLDDQAKLATCIEAELSGWQFARSQLGAELHVPLVLAGRQRGGSSAGTVSPRALHQTMVAQRASLSPCFSTIEGAPPPLSASLSIDASGNTRVAQLRGADRQPGLKTCLRDAMLAWRFPRASKGAEFAFPL